MYAYVRSSTPVYKHAYAAKKCGLMHLATILLSLFLLCTYMDACTMPSYAARRTEHASNSTCPVSTIEYCPTKYIFSGTTNGIFISDGIVYSSGSLEYASLSVFWSCAFFFRNVLSLFSYRLHVMLLALSRQQQLRQLRSPTS